MTMPPYSFPLERRYGSSFNQTYLLFTQGCFVSSLVDICLVILKKQKCENFTDGQSDRWGREMVERWMLNKKWSGKVTWIFSSGELKKEAFSINWKTRNPIQTLRTTNWWYIQVKSNYNSHRAIFRHLIVNKKFWHTYCKSEGGSFWRKNIKKGILTVSVIPLWLIS